MADNDFVERLRIRWETMGDMANDERAAAAAEIESLRHGQREMMRTIATRKDERNMARVQVCLLAARIKHGDEYPISKAMEIAETLGWDCFKEDGK